VEELAYGPLNKMQTETDRHYSSEVYCSVKQK